MTTKSYKSEAMLGPTGAEASGPAWTRLQRIGGEAALFVVDDLVLFGRQEIDIARFPRVTVFRVKF